MKLSQAQPQYLEALLRSADTPITLQLDVVTVFQLVSLLQLALRHPTMDLEGSPARIARAFIDAFKERLRPSEPLLVELIDLGDQPEDDQPGGT